MLTVLDPEDKQVYMICNNVNELIKLRPHALYSLKGATHL
jgi:hypothetical protein